MDDLRNGGALRCGSVPTGALAGAADRRATRGGSVSLRRREGLLLALAGMACLPRPAIAQPSRPLRIGLLLPRQQQFRAHDLLERLQQQGWRQGETLEVEQRIADTPELLEQFATELVRLRVDLIVAFLTPAVLAARQASASVPIVISGAAVDPVLRGLARSLSDPGGNVTGIVVPGVHLASKSLELVRELRQPTRRVGVLANAADPFTPELLEALRVAALSLGIRLDMTMVRHRDEYVAAFATWQAAAVDAVFVQPSLAIEEATALALSHRLPSFSFARAFVSSGGLLSYAANTSELTRRSVDYVDRVLRGTVPARLPIEQATSYDLTLNLRTARALGITVPNLLMLRATDIID